VDHSFRPHLRRQGALFAKYILGKRPSAGIAVHYENHDLGRDYVSG